ELRGRSASPKALKLRHRLIAVQQAEPVYKLRVPVIEPIREVGCRRRVFVDRFCCRVFKLYQCIRRSATVADDNVALVHSQKIQLRSPTINRTNAAVEQTE